MTFSSFWMAGFESASHINRGGKRLDLIAATQHDRFARDDYRRLRALDIAVTREGVRWPIVERPGGFDLTTVIDMAVAAGRMDLVRELADDYEDEALQLMLSVEAGAATQPSDGTAEIIELGRGSSHRSERWRFWRHKKR